MTLPPEKKTPQMNRRVFCNRVLATSAGVMLMANSLEAEAQPQQGLVAHPPRKIDGAEKLMPGEYLYFEYPKPNDPAILIRSQEGQYLAFSRKCAHLGCSVNYDVMRRCLLCPCHRGSYDTRTGSVIYGPPPRPLDQIVLQMRAGGEVWAVGMSFGSNDSRA
jgi:Rieske Fe-S protein